MKNSILSKVFTWFGLGLFVTFLIAYLTSTNINALAFIFSGSTYFIIIILEFAIAIWLGVRIHKMSETAAKVLYLGYSALTGLTFSSIFVAYEITSIIWIFLASSLTFGIFAMLGKSDKFDLSNYGVYLIVALVSSLILELINIFLVNSTLNMILCILVLAIFTIYVAYDVQKIIRRGYDSEQLAIYGAFDLYLDFINIFLRLLQLFGNRRD